MSFRLVTLLYVFAVVGASLAVFGVFGIVASSALIALAGKQRWAGYTAAVVLLLLFGGFVEQVHHARQAAQGSACHGHLFYLATAVYNYHDVVGRLPPVASANGTSGDLQSWRLLLLPYMESSPLYASYNLNEPWNGPTNRGLPTADIYKCPTHGHASLTNYLAIVGPQTAWGDGERRTFAEITDGLEQTILLIDTSYGAINWKQPRDLTFEEAVKLLTSPVNPDTFDGHYDSPGLFRKAHYHRKIVMADRSYHRLRAPLDRELAIALLTATGGEQIDLSTLEDLGEPEWDLEKIWGVAIFLALTLLPAIPAARRRVWPSWSESNSKRQVDTS